MSFLAGSKALKRLVQEGDPLTFIHAKLSDKLFVGDELPLYQMVSHHLKEFHTLPHPATLEEQFPQTAQIVVNEPSSYYLKELENRYGYTIVERAREESKKILKADPKAVDEAVSLLSGASQEWNLQKYRHKVLDYTAEAHDALTTFYFSPPSPAICQFGWPYIDGLAGGMGPGDVFSLAGRTGSGKTYLALYVAAYNAFMQMKNVLMVSMEIVPFVLAQRVSAMNSHLPVQQVMTKQLSSKSLKKWLGSLQTLATSGTGKLYLVDGNLAANADDVYQLASALKCKLVVIDGAYLLRHPNQKLDRYTRVAENAELIKQRTTTLQVPSLCTWQFKSESETKLDKKNGAVIKRQKTVDDIGYAPAAISQISSTILGLEQPESVETLVRRRVTLMKGRNGEVGSWWIKWLFDTMDFTEVDDSQSEVELENL